MIGLPTEEHPLGASVGYRVDLSSSLKVNQAIDYLNGVLQLNNWVNTDPQYARMTFTVDLPITGGGGAFTLIVLYWYGKAYKMFSPTTGDTDPSGDILLGVGPNGEDATVVGIATVPGMGQNELIQLLADTMSDAGDFKGTLADIIDAPGNAFDGVAGSILFTAKVDGPDYNDVFGNGNVLGGGLFRSLSKYGGYRLKSELNPYTFLDITLLNDERSQLLIKTQFGAGPLVFMRKAILSDIVMHRITNYMVLCGPAQFILTPMRYPTDYHPDNIVDVLQGTFDYWICAPYVPPNQIFEANNITLRTRAILACAFRIMTARDQLHSSVAAVAIGGNFAEATFSAPDIGVMIFPLNSHYNLAGPLLSPTDLPVTMSALVGISDGLSFADREAHVALTQTEALICGYIWDAHMTFKYEPIQTIGFFNGKEYVAYRSQAAPLECTLWMWTGRIK